MTDRSSARAGPADTYETSETTQRAVSPLVGHLMLLAITVVVATVIVVGASAWTLDSSVPIAVFDLSVDGEQSTVAIEHGGGDSIDVTELSIRIEVNGIELTDQPPVPFVGASGFDGAPEGPFNSKADPQWQTGERVSVVVAETNAPGIDAGDSVTVTLVVDDSRVATLETTAA